MKVEQIMTRAVRACHPDDMLDAAARIMWERDCGCVPVVVDEEGGARVVGMLTDRDVCMAAYTQGRPLAAIAVKSAMSERVCSCRPTDAVQVVLNVLRTNQLHRLPVVDGDEHLVGVVSLADIAREAEREHGRKKAPEVADADVAQTVEAVSRPRTPRELVRSGGREREPGARSRASAQEASV
jgi:CBS domain-containing protein